MGLLLVLAVTAVGILAADRLLLALEARGLVYWRRRKPGGGSATGNAMLAMQAFVEPGARAVQETVEREEQVEDGESEPPTRLTSR